MSKLYHWYTQNNHRLLDMRYLPFKKFDAIFKSILEDIEVDYTYAIEGHSVNKIPIASIQFGSGPVKILMWSQMHGNESTTTRALLMFLNYLQETDYLEHVTLFIIPMLNPDGSDAYTRENANQVDLNRDAQALSQPESRVLRACFDRFKPDYCFNLHDQRSIYGVTNSHHPAQLSFLAPSCNEEKSITPARIDSMHIINSIYAKVLPLCTGVIARYDDSFNINCVGDTFMSLGVPTILFEAGHADQDYLRNESMWLLFNALNEAVKAVTDVKRVSQVSEKQLFTEYTQIPEIVKNFTDIYIDSAIYNGKTTEPISIQFEERLQNGSIQFVPIISDIKPDQVLNAHKKIRLATIESSFNNDKLQIGEEISYKSNNL